jgi:hypothetical protein
MLNVSRYTWRTLCTHYCVSFDFVQEDLVTNGSTFVVRQKYMNSEVIVNCLNPFPITHLNLNSFSMSW